MIRRFLTALAILATLLVAPLAALAQMPGGVQVPGVGTIPTGLPSKDTLLQQANSMVSDLTSMKSSGKLDAMQAKQVDSMLPKAQSLTSELAKPQIPSSKLTQLATSVSDLQKDLATLKSLVK